MALKLTAMVGVLFFEHVRTACDCTRLNHNARATVLAVLSVLQIW
jgi:hypothetical protein